MKLSLSKKANVNYVCTAFQFKEYMRHPHGNADKLEIVTYQGCPVIVQKGLYKDGEWLVLFPTETHISKSFLSEHNAFRHTELNKDPQAAAGFFEDNCRVKAISLRGVISRGYIVPISHLNLTPSDVVDGLNFDTVNGKLLVKKYIIPVQVPRSETGRMRQSRKKSELARIVEGQFEFHYDTEMLAKNLDLLNPDDVITLTHKWHGTSLISGRLLCNRRLSLFERLKRLFGKSVQMTEYRLITSSRKRILTLQDKTENERNFENSSVSDKLYLDASKVLEPYIADGMTVYSEIVGYLPSGKDIQKGYDYKCERGQFKVMPYRITKFDSDGSGRWSEFTSQEVNDYAVAASMAEMSDMNIATSAATDEKAVASVSDTNVATNAATDEKAVASVSDTNVTTSAAANKEAVASTDDTNIATKATAGTKANTKDAKTSDTTAKTAEAAGKKARIVPTIIAYKGTAKNLYSDLQTEDIQQWRNEFLARLSNDKKFYMNEDSPDCNNSVPHEGLVMRFENRPTKRALKIKCDKFYEYESKMLDTQNETLE
ncbi:MAG: hypothetical protein LBF01_02950 [Bacteroidales bacterium]|jgi:RNA ligase (TIGR02306 family)|nr:hypothetical protein [Bacteroidales bacterium]